MFLPTRENNLWKKRPLSLASLITSLLSLSHQQLSSSDSLIWAGDKTLTPLCLRFQTLERLQAEGNLR